MTTKIWNPHSIKTDTKKGRWKEGSDGRKTKNKKEEEKRERRKQRIALERTKTGGRDEGRKGGDRVKKEWSDEEKGVYTSKRRRMREGRSQSVRLKKNWRASTRQTSAKKKEVLWKRINSKNIQVLIKLMEGLAKASATTTTNQRKWMSTRSKDNQLSEDRQPTKDIIKNHYEDENATMWMIIRSKILRK